MLYCTDDADMSAIAHMKSVFVLYDGTLNIAKRRAASCSYAQSANCMICRRPLLQSALVTAATCPS